jgi:hypothetical protein
MKRRSACTARLTGAAVSSLGMELRGRANSSFDYTVAATFDPLHFS